MSIASMAIGLEDLDIEGIYIVDYDNLEDLSNDIALESDAIALEGMVADMTLSISKGLTATVSGLTGRIGSFRRSLFSKESKLDRLSGEVPFMDLEKVIVSIPESFSGYLADYTEDVVEINRQLSSDIVDVLNKHELKLSSIVSNDKYNGMVNYNKDFKKENMKVSKQKKLYSSHFPKNTGKQIDKATAVYGNWAEIISTDSMLDQKNKDTHRLASKEELEDVTNKVNKINTILLDLRQGLQNEGNKKRIRTLKDIASSIFLLAQHVEFYSMMVNAHMTMIELNKSNIDTIVKEGGK